MRDSIISVENVPGLVEAQSAEEYLPPHKMAGFVPYDAVVGIEAPTWTEEDVEDALEDAGVTVTEVTGVETNTDPSLDGDRTAFVDL